MEIVNLVGQLPTHPTLKYKTRTADQKIERIVIHHSATVQTEISRDATIRHIKSIARGHVENNDWPGIGYHYVIGPGGIVYRVNDVGTISYHVGNHNATSIGICLLGDFTKGNPTDNQIASARELVFRLGWPVVPHKALMQTQCPGDWAGWGNRIVYAVNHELRAKLLDIRKAVDELLVIVEEQEPYHG